jgi:glycosyltransferase involved in cell wall biosynthesis
MKDVKVVHITTVAASLRYLCLGLLRHLTKTGYTVMAVSSPGPGLTAMEQAELKHIPIPMTRRITPIADLLALWRLYRTLRREGATIVHTHTPKANLLGQLAARLAGVPIRVSTVHGLYFTSDSPAVKRSFFHTIETWSAKFADTVFLVNREDMDTVRRRRICVPAKLRLLGGGIGIDVRRFNRETIEKVTLKRTRAELGLPDDCQVVGFVGRLVAEKGLPELLRAAWLIRKRGTAVRFLIIGPIDHGKSDAVTPDLARESGVEDICVFTGERSDMAELYALMDVFVLPSHREGCPCVVMEASAMGVPCVVTDVRGCREVVEHEKTGLIVSRGNGENLAAAIIELIEHPAEAQRMGNMARQMALKRFDERAVFDKVQAEYARLLRQKGVAASIPSVRPALEPAT